MMATEVSVLPSRDMDEQENGSVALKRSRWVGEALLVRFALVEAEDATKRWLRSPACFICMNFFLSQWGDWMWQFAVGLYLYKLHDDSLILSAIYGLTGGCLVLLLGGVIGDWVDRNGRLKVVRISLFTQNLSVALSCVAVCLRLSIVVVFDHYWLLRLMEGLVIVTALVAQLANVAYKIAIEKDWIVVIAAGSSSRLANLNAISRSIDLICKVLSPTVAGCIMSYASMLVSAIVIAAWNVISVFIEYGILSLVYRRVPDLAVKKRYPEATEQEMTTMVDKTNTGVDKMLLHADSKATSSNHPVQTIKVDDVESNVAAQADALNGSPRKKSKKSVKSKNASSAEETVDENSCVPKMRTPLSVLGNAWKTFGRQRVVFASVSLSLLYMTVLGFDSITTAYIYANDVSESFVGLSMALGGVTGVIGTVLFTRLQRLLGLERTGLIAFGTEIGFLILAVVSIWLPGSKFDPYFSSLPACNASHFNTSSNALNRSFTGDSVNVIGINFTSAVRINETLSGSSSTIAAGVSESSESFVPWFNESGSSNMFGANSSAVACVHADGQINVSIIVLLVGIVMSRVGLWMADLAVTQIMQEAVIETERGVVNGVQNSLNMLMDMLKFALVIALPQIEIFGVHILISYSFIVMAGASFAYHCWRVGLTSTS